MMAAVEPAHIVSIVGNPKARGRTSDAAWALARVVAEQIEASGREVTTSTIELADLGPGLLAWGDEAVAAALADARSADVLVVASPTFKATYTGLLKLFLDQVPTNGLAGVVAIPLMLGGAPNHALAVEAYLRPLLVEIGASVPTAGLYVLDSQVTDIDTVLDAWLEAAAPSLSSALRLAVLQELS